LELKVSVPEIREVVNQIIAAPRKIFELCWLNLKELMHKFLGVSWFGVTGQESGHGYGKVWA